MHPSILLDQVTVHLSGRPVFENLSWAIRPGEHWAVVGPTGSGKTALADTLRCRVELVRGRILFSLGPEECQPKAWPDPGQIVCVSSESHRQFTQRYAAYHQARWNSSEADGSPAVADVLLYGTVRPDSVGLEQRHDSPFGQELVDAFGIRHLLRRKVPHISNGETRRLLIARAFLQAPRVLILDDPYCGLDQESRENLHGVIDQMSTRATPQIIFMTSRPEDVPSSISHVLMLDSAGVIRGCVPKAMERSTGSTPLSSDQGQEPRNTGSTSQRSGDPDLGGRPPAEVLKPHPEADLGTCPDARHLAVVDMRGVTVQYGDVRPLDDIWWTMRSGERWALLGHNGAGKSTLLSLVLADNPQAYSNPVWVFGMRRGSGETIWEIKRRIGFVSPELGMLYQADISCLEVACSGFHDSIGLYRKCTAEQVECAIGRMETLGIESLRDRRILSISTGQARLVLLARALVRKPSLLILDEPCQGLDLSCRTRFLEMVDQVCTDPAVSLIYVSHRPEEIPACVSHQLVLERGRVAHIGRR